jgi:hypothetical protein
MLDMDKVTSAAKLAAVKGTTKAAVLRGDSCNLVALCIYDQVPVRVLSTTIESLVWMEKERNVWCHEKQQFEPMKFLRLNVIDQYNHNMGYVDQPPPPLHPSRVLHNDLYHHLIHT